MNLPEDIPDDEGAQDVSENNSLLSVADDVIIVDPSSDTETEDPPAGDHHRRFDTDLPTMHRYLGGLTTISGYNIFEDGERLTIVGMHTNTIVSPGFTLPLVLDMENEQEIMKKCIADKCVFAVIFENDRGGNIFPYGVIMEIFESVTNQGTMYLKARGRQRIKILPNEEVRYLGGRLVEIIVNVLAEPDIKSPISCSQLLRLKGLRPFYYQHKRLGANFKYRQYHLAQFPQASWIYDRNEVTYYCQLVTDLLARYHSRDVIPSGAVPLSFWFVQNFQLLHEERLEILKMDSVLERLKLEYQFLLMHRRICCRVCRQNLAEYSNVFAMSKDGVQSTYCNPGGHVYETITITEIRNYELIGSRSKEFSWFPGYDWTIVQCLTCKCHIGWQFNSKHLEPREFFGLARTSLDIKIFNRKDKLTVI